MISYVKARAEAAGLSGEGGLIERPERLAIVLLGAGLSGLPFYPCAVAAARRRMWVLAVASLITLGQRVHTVRTSPGAMEPLQKAESVESDVAGNSGDKPDTWGHSHASGGRTRPEGRGTSHDHHPDRTTGDWGQPLLVRGASHRFGLCRGLASGPRDAGVGGAQRVRRRRHLRVS